MDFDDDLDDDMLQQLVNLEETIEGERSKDDLKQGASFSIKNERETQLTNDKMLYTQTTQYSQKTKSKPDPEHLEVLNRCFGHANFRPIQWDIISAVMERRDVCAIMTTGYGKSLCYQFPSTFLGGLTLVISPLISLMEDQILSLNVNNIPACLLGSAQKAKAKVMEDIFNHAYNLVYLTPEFCSGDYGKRMLTRMASELEITLIAIDEAHCISSWGHDFRPQYRYLGMIRNYFPTTPILAVTATATPRVRLDMSLCLRMKNPLMVCSGFDRPNLYIEVNYQRSDTYTDLKKTMVFQNNKWHFNGPTIVYVIKRADAEEVAEILQGKGVNALPYHAGLPLKVRKETHEKFVNDKIDVICATIAFGMGIDKHDVRNIIHYGCSGSIESYYQEIGRAGRDGLPARCITFWSQSNLDTYRYLAETRSNYAPAIERTEEQLKMMSNYLQTTECRRKFVLSYFCDNTDHMTKPQPNCCDNCTKRRFDKRSDFEKYEGLDDAGNFDFTDDFQIIANAVHVMKGKFGLSQYILFLRGSRSAKMNPFIHETVHGCGKQKSEEWWKIVGALMVQNKYLSENYTNGSGYHYKIVTLSDLGRVLLQDSDAPNFPRILLKPPAHALKFLKEKPNYSTLRSSSAASPEKPSTSKTVAEDPKQMEERMTLYRKLLEKRAELAAEIDCTPYIVTSNTALMQMARFKPKSIEEMRTLNLDGMTEAKISKFGVQFLRVIDPLSNLLSSTSIKLPIRDILDQKPMPNVKKSLATEITYGLFKSGMTVGEIAAKRKVNENTITNHLLTALKMGYPIKLADLGVTQETRESVIDAIKELYNSDNIFNAKLSPIKKMCPDVNSTDISFILGYLQVRHHLKSLGFNYEEFEEFLTSSQANDNKSQDAVSKDCIMSSQFSNDDRLSDLIAFCDDVMKDKGEIKDKRETNCDAVINEEKENISGGDFNPILDLPPACELVIEEALEPLAEVVVARSNDDDNIELSQPVGPVRSSNKRSKKVNMPAWLVKKTRR